MDNYTKATYPKSRLATFDVGKIGSQKHNITGFIEVDVTKARDIIKKKIKAGENISLLSWLIKVISKTISENKYIHSINYRKRSQIIFNDIDISLPIEKVVNGKKVPLAMLIKSVNKKTIGEIYNEINSSKNKEVKSEKDYVLSDNSKRVLTSVFFNLPQFLRLLVWKHLLKNPFRIKENLGTALITNVGLSSNVPGWILPKSIHNLCFAVGSIVKKPWIVNNKIEIREIMHLTILFDHDVVDGSPAVIFTNNLVKNIELAKEL